MSQVPQSDVLLVERIRAREEDAWVELIDRFEGRLLAFVHSRLRNRAAAEDVVQEALIGFLKSVPNFDTSRPLESYLFSIAAYKLTDHLRREGRRPALPFSSTTDSDGQWELPGGVRTASSIMRSGERRELEATALVAALQSQFDAWREKSDWRKIACMELLFTRGWANKEVAAELGLSEQQVANFKFDFLARLRKTIRRQDLPIEVFPELQEPTEP